jgi:hypothetical protein
VKAALGAVPAQEGLTKLAQLNKLAAHLPPDFSSFLVFFELPNDVVPRGDMLKHLLPSEPVAGLRGGLVLRCSLNAEMSGTLMWTAAQGPDAGTVNKVPDLPLAKDIDLLNIHLNSSGGAVIHDIADGMMIFGNGVGVDVSKMYSPDYSGADAAVHLSWSANGFSRFALDLLAWLEGGKPTKDAPYRFAQVFDHLERR